MSRHSVSTSVLVAVGVIVGCLAAFYAGQGARNYLGSALPAAYAEDPEPIPDTVAERVWVDDEEQGILKAGDEEILRIQTTAGGLTGYERAMIAAKRINDALAAGTSGSEVAPQQVGDQWAVTIGERLLITANSQEASQAGGTPEQLAQQWADQITVALLITPPSPEEDGETAEEVVTEEPGPEGEEVVEEPAAEGGTEEAAEWQPAEPYKNKIVPIISVLEGVRIGIARVNGPQSAVNQVQAVAQLETHYNNILEIDVYVPISTKVPGKTLARVQGVGVTGLGDLRL